MSCWTHITACFSVETGVMKKRADLKKEVQKTLNQAPKITGSEGDADIFVNIQNGSNWFISHDCEHCKYKNTLKRIVDEEGHEYEECDGPDDYECSAEYQTCVVISIQGDLRDRISTKTQSEFDDFVKFLNKHFTIRDYAYNIEGDY